MQLYRDFCIFEIQKIQNMEGYRGKSQTEINNELFDFLKTINFEEDEREISNFEWYLKKYKVESYSFIPPKAVVSDHIFNDLTYGQLNVSFCNGVVKYLHFSYKNGMVFHFDNFKRKMIID